MEPQLISFELRRPVALAWYYAIANWPGWTRLPELDVSHGPMKVSLERSEAAFHDLQEVLVQASGAGDPAVTSSANALLAEIQRRLS